MTTRIVAEQKRTFFDRIHKIPTKEFRFVGEKMAGQDITLELKKRETVRKRLNNLRKEGFIPAVIHDHGSDSIHVQADYITLLKTYNAAGKHHPVQLDIDGKKHLALIKDVDFEPVKRRMRHVVFQAIKQDEKVEAEIPIVLQGEIPAERAGLVVLKQLDEVEVEALPRNLVDSLTVDASTLAEVGDKLTVADIKVPAGLTILTEPEHQIVIVEMPRDQVAEANAAAEELAADAGQAQDEVPATEQAGDEAGEEEPGETSDKTEEQS
jgi:large subunit ribosomal protein L25